MAETRNSDITMITVSGKVLGEILGIGDRQVRNLAEQGIIKKDSHGKYVLLVSVKNYITSLKVAKAGTKVMSDFDETLDLDTEKAKHEHIKRQITDIKLQLAKNSVHKSEDVERVISDMFEKFRSKMNALPAKLAKKLQGKDKGAIQLTLKKEIDSALSELADYNPADYYSDEHLEIADDYIQSLGEEWYGEE